MRLLNCSEAVENEFIRVLWECCQRVGSCCRTASQFRLSQRSYSQPIQQEGIHIKHVASVDVEACEFLDLCHEVLESAISPTPVWNHYARPTPYNNVNAYQRQNQKCIDTEVAIGGGYSYNSRLPGVPRLPEGERCPTLLMQGDS